LLDRSNSAAARHVLDYVLVPSTSCGCQAGDGLE
jgi:LacI family transcriptional regulator